MFAPEERYGVRMYRRSDHSNGRTLRFRNTVNINTSTQDQ